MTQRTGPPTGPGEDPLPALVDAILELLAARDPGKTICPSEAARQVGGKDWRDLMEPARQAARRLAAGGRIEITQRREVVGPDADFKGPIRLGHVGSEA